MGLLLELNIALIPNPDTSQALVSASKLLAKHYQAIVTLEGPDARLSLAPHFTLYQVPVPVSKLQTLDQLIVSIAKRYPSQLVTHTGYAYNKGEGSFEVSYEVGTSLLALQAEAIGAANPLRDGMLLERDPAGNRLSDLRTRPDVLGENVRRTGYAEVGDPGSGGLFRPHATLNWFVPTSHLDVELLPPPPSLNGTYSAIGVFALGPHGTCPQLLSAHELKG